MNLSKQSLEKIGSHWALTSIGESGLDQAGSLAEYLHIKQSVGDSVNWSPKQDVPGDDIDEILHRAATAYEIAALEGIDKFRYEDRSTEDMSRQCASGAYQAFGILRHMSLPDDSRRLMFHVLHLSSLAYVSERSADLRRWYRENSFNDLELGQKPDWELRLLHTIYECWIILFGSKTKESLNSVGEKIDELRALQGSEQPALLKTASGLAKQRLYIRLMGLYNWAKATELQAEYMLDKKSATKEVLARHFEAAVDAARAGGDPFLELLLQWLHVASLQMRSDSIWLVSQVVNSKVTEFVRELAYNRGLFEMLPPQRSAVAEQNLLDPAKTSTAVNLPTSAGKTFLAELKMLQVLNQHADPNIPKRGWVAYVAPTRALVAQITRRLRKDFSPIGVNIEQLSGAIEFDIFEEELIDDGRARGAFDILVSTPEKFQLLLRNNKIGRPLALAVFDEAHNIENESRGLRIELLMATIKREYRQAGILALMPYVENADTISRWLSQEADRANTIHIESSQWFPNDRLIGLISAKTVENNEDAKPKDAVAKRKKWQLQFETMVGAKDALGSGETYLFQEQNPLGIATGAVLLKERTQQAPTKQLAAAAHALSSRGTCIAVGRTIRDAWAMARAISERGDQPNDLPKEIRLVQNFLKAEISPDYELVTMLQNGVGVHHAELADEARTLIEWLAENGKLKVLCATTTIAQGINFPVSSILLGAVTQYNPDKKQHREMSSREFWNLVGRAGRLDHDSVGVVGIYGGGEPEKIKRIVCEQTGLLISRLQVLLEEVSAHDDQGMLREIINDHAWTDFRCYIAHMVKEKASLDGAILESGDLLRSTLGYSEMEKSAEKNKAARKLLEVSKSYIHLLNEQISDIGDADATGLSPEDAKKAKDEVRGIDGLNAGDWRPESLFGDNTKMADLCGAILKVPQLEGARAPFGGRGPEGRKMAEVAKSWATGESILGIAKKHFNAREEGAEKDNTKAIGKACKAIYKTLGHEGAWGLSALSHLARGEDDATEDETARRKRLSIPAMLYYGVDTEEAVLLRMNSVPRSIAPKLGVVMREAKGSDKLTVGVVRDYLKSADISVWERACDSDSPCSAEEYQQVWRILSGES